MPTQMGSSGDMRAFQSLSYADQWRVTRFLAKGKAPRDPRMAAAAVELAQSYQRRGRVATALARWLPVAVVIGGGAVAVQSVASEDWLAATILVLPVLVNLAHLMFNPMARPQNVARALEASRRASAVGN